MTTRSHCPFFLLVPPSLLVLFQTLAVLVPCLLGFDYTELAHVIQGEGRRWYYAGGTDFLEATVIENQYTVRAVAQALLTLKAADGRPVKNTCNGG